MTQLSSPRTRGLLLGGMIGLLQLFFNWPVLDHDWVYFDDDINILLNPHLTGDAWETARWAWTDLSYTRRYMPLGWMLFDGLLAAGGLNPAVYHLAGWLLAAGNSILLFLIARRILTHSPQTSAWQDAGTAAAVIILSLHPWRAETAGWSSGLLYLVGQFLASLAVLTAWPSTRQPVAVRVLPTVLFGLALLVYPVFLSLPLVLIFAQAGCDDMRGRWLAAIQRYGTWLALALVLGGLNWYAAATAGQGFTATEGPADYSFAERWNHFTALGSHYVGGLLWPGETSPFYGTASSLGMRGLSHGAAVVALAVAAGFLAWPRTRARAGLILGLLAASLLPFAGLLDQHQTANDRYAFLLLGVVTVLLARLLLLAPAGPGRAAGLGAAALLAVIMLPAYRQALAVWTDTDHLQARIDRITAARPHARLTYARPAITACLLGRNEQAADRLAAGVARLGPQPEILAAVEFIRQTNGQSSARSGDRPRVAPYVLLHLELARAHRTGGRSRAAEAHELFAGRLHSRRVDLATTGPAK